jgi:hypothetical protein
MGSRRGRARTCVVGGRQRAGAGQRDAPVAGAQAQDAAEAGRHAHAAACVAAQRDVCAAVRNHHLGHKGRRKPRWKNPRSLIRQPRARQLAAPVITTAMRCEASCSRWRAEYVLEITGAFQRKKEKLPGASAISTCDISGSSGIFQGRTAEPEEEPPGMRSGQAGLTGVP